jgi:carbon-monoxide dehydrogenase medium subunit
VKPPAFDYRDPDSLEEALALLAELREDAALLAGGQSLIPLLNLRLANPAVVVDLRRVPLADVRVGDGGVRIEAMARAADVEVDSGVARALPALVEAIHHVAHPQIRSRTTIGGSVAHADPASEIPAVLAAADGSVILRSAERGERSVPASEFFAGVFTTAREPDEAVTAVEFPAISGRSVFVEVARRPGDFALVGACVGLDVADRRIREARIALSGVGDGPVRMREAEAGLRGKEPTARVIDEAARAVAGSVRPRSDLHASARFRASLAGTLVHDALAALAAPAGAGV